MQKENFRDADYPRFKVHWSVKLLGWAWVAALVFITGMVIGGMLGFIDEPGEEDTEAEAVPEAAGEAGTVLEAPCLDQRGEFPTGCESVTAVMALRYAGVDITVEMFVDSYLPKGSAPHPMSNGTNVETEYICADPNQCFLGDPRSEDGRGCYAPVIKQAAERVLEDYRSERQVEDLGGAGLEELVEGYIKEGVPVMVWATQGMEEPVYGETLTVEGSGRRFDWISPEHCLLLVGEEGDTYLFNDPLEGRRMAYEKKAVQRAYEALGSQALAIK